ncbi:MAG: glycine zipper domain-containing protein, partial [Planctomycetota bacterium]|nr:glycine zipper domain-containing protein [Planctomycetota bacterium]
MNRHWLLSSLALLFVVPNFGRAQDHTGPGALLGGVAGALAGAAIGKNNHSTAAGALIGGAAGVVTGAAVGSVMDEKERARAYQYQQQ